MKTTDKQYQNLSDEDLRNRLNVLLEDTAKIRYQVGEAKSKVAENGVYSDTIWFRKATFALGMKGVEQQAIQSEIGRRRRQRKISAEECFIRAAKRILQPALFQEIMDESKLNLDCQHE